MQLGQMMKAIAAALSAVAVTLPTVAFDGTITQTDYVILLASALAPLIVTYLTPNQNSDGTWGMPSLPSKDTIEQIQSSITALVTALVSTGVLHKDDPVVVADPVIGTAAAAAPEPVAVTETPAVPEEPAVAAEPAEPLPTGDKHSEVVRDPSVTDWSIFDEEKKDA